MVYGAAAYFLALVLGLFPQCPGAINAPACRPQLLRQLGTRAATDLLPSGDLHANDLQIYRLLINIVNVLEMLQYLPEYLSSLFGKLPSLFLRCDRPARKHGSQRETISLTMD